MCAVAACVAVSGHTVAVAHDDVYMFIDVAAMPLLCRVAARAARAQSQTPVHPILKSLLTDRRYARLSVVFHSLYDGCV